MRTDTKILLCVGGGVYALTMGGADLLFRMVCATGAYFLTQASTGQEIKRAVDALEKSLEDMPEDKRKLAMARANAQFHRDLGALRLSSFAVAAGTFFNPFVGAAALALFGASKHQAETDEIEADAEECRQDEDRMAIASLRSRVETIRQARRAH